MKKVLLLIENGFEDMEAMYPYYRLQEAGYTVDVVGPITTVYKGKYGYPIMAALTPADVRISDYNAVVIPGGQAPDRMRISEDMVDLLRAAAAKNIIIGAICHGPQMLIEAAIIRGKKVTCYKSIRTDIINAGGIFQDLPVIVDGLLVTARKPQDLPLFCKELLAIINKKE